MALVLSNWRQNAYVMVHIKTGNGTPIVIELASPANDNSAGSQSTMVPVFSGQKLWGTRNPEVLYGDALFIPYLYA